jgi:polysaccharide biosynthesis transport protein
MIANSTKPKFDILALISQAFSYIKHIRLMVLMMSFGILAGIVCFLFMRPVFESSAMISVKSFGAPVQTQGVTISATAHLMRGLVHGLNSPRVQLEAAKQMGLLGPGADADDLKSVVPRLRVSMLDNNNLQMTVIAYKPEVVRGFAKAMVSAYEDIQRKNYFDFRDAAIVRYGEQVERLENEISETISSISIVEREQRLTEVTLQQQSLLQIPKDLAETREQLERMKGVRSLLEKLESHRVVSGVETVGQESDDQISNLISLLSLLDSFEDETQVTVGDVVSAPGRSSSPVRSTVGNLAGTIVNASEVESLEPWRELEKERRNLLDEINQKSKTFLPNHIVMEDLKSKLITTERGLETEFKIMRQKFDLNYASLQDKEKMLEARVPEYHAVTEQLGKTAHTYSSILAKQAMWDKARAELASKVTTLDFLEEFDWIEIRFRGMINLRDDVPTSPNKMRILLIALAIGAAGAFGLPTVLNLADTSIKSIAALEEVTGISGIGIVPLTSKEMLEDVSRSPAQGSTVPNYLLECFRVIRANIVMHPNRHNRTQVVMVTSARPQEGKTSQASNLAWAFHSMGEKTLLIDCDLRRGRIHGVVGIDKAPGMTRLLLGEYTKEEVIQSSGPGGFDVIPRGPVIAGTTDLLCQGVFHDLIEQFRKDYDRIVIDAPPVLGLSESSSLQEVVDGTVLVVRAEKTGRKDIMDAISLLRRCNAHFFGFVLNAVDLSKLGNYYNYYYYSAPYYDQVESEEEPEQLVKKRPRLTTGI